MNYSAQNVVLSVTGLYQVHEQYRITNTPCLQMAAPCVSPKGFNENDALEGLYEDAAIVHDVQLCVQCDDVC